MRLLNARTLELQEFSRDKIPAYAILSHTWGDDEVTIESLHLGRYTQQKGYKKIKYTVRQALNDRLEWAWIDTCCIDKTSSAELSEAINSMFDWYRCAKLCYVYLEDFQCSQRSSRPLAQCRWFTRGWTLQELIAPKEMCFFDRDWTFFATRREKAEQLCEITGISRDILRGVLFLSDALRQYSVAQRMSWAANRTTTRLEDRAYSLLGLFGVNMPLLYGEGTASFKRLQEEIMKTRADLSILAWSSSLSTGSFDDFDVLAGSPDDFKSCGDLVLRSEKGEALTVGEITVTNVALHVTARVLDKTPRSYKRDTFDSSGRLVMILPCGRIGDVTRLAAMTLRPLESSFTDPEEVQPSSSSKAPGNLEIIHCAKDRLEHVDALDAQERSSVKSLFIARYFRGDDRARNAAVAMVSSRPHPSKVWVRFSDPNLQMEATVLKAWPSDLWNKGNRTLDISGKSPSDLQRYYVEGYITVWHSWVGEITIAISYDNNPLETRGVRTRYTFLNEKAGLDVMRKQFKTPSIVHVDKRQVLKLSLNAYTALFDEELMVLEIERNAKS